MTPSRSIRPQGLLHWLVLLLMIAVAAAAFWYVQQRRALVCAVEGEGSWSLTYADGDHISKFMWAIQPADQKGFLSCLEDSGYKLKKVTATGEITALADSGQTISNTIGDDFVQNGKFYKW